jgi:hypothetical protein
MLFQTRAALCAAVLTCLSALGGCGSLPYAHGASPVPQFAAQADSAPVEVCTAPNGVRQCSGEGAPAAPVLARRNPAMTFTFITPYPCTPGQAGMDRFLFGSATPPCGRFYQPRSGWFQYRSGRHGSGVTGGMTYYPYAYPPGARADYYGPPLF